jgi:hypothetical protein
MTSSNYGRIVEANLKKLFRQSPSAIARRLPAAYDGDGLTMQALGKHCRLGPQGIWLDGQRQQGPLGILISLYALQATESCCRLEPLRAFKDFPDSMPYRAAFNAHTQQPLVAHVTPLKQHRQRICSAWQGREDPLGMGGDFAFVVYPLPKIALYYIFYEADEDFPASVTCLFSSNAPTFLPLDALADLGEYTSKALLALIGI